MIVENTKLLLRLYYKPVSSMSGIIDGGHWLYGVIAMALISVVMQFAVTSHIYIRYEAVYRPIENASVNPAQTESSQAQHVVQIHRDAAKLYGYESPYFRFDRLPLPVVGNYGWWFVTFAPDSVGSILGLALLYVPFLILLTVLFESVGSFSVVLRRDYGPLLTCTLMAWAASHLPFALAGVALTKLGRGANTALVVWLMSALVFGVLMAFGIRTLFGLTLKKALPIVCLAGLAFSIQAKLFATVSPFLFSPFLLYYAYIMFRGDIGDIGFSLRQRQSFRRSMEAATINPRDASAHYQLGLIFQHRRQYTEAISRFQQAVEIAHDETDAHFQLGRIAREQGRLQDAIDCFGVVLSQDDKHSRSEIWREVGATYLAAEMYTEAREALEKFVERRAYDPEGLYHYGKTLEHLGEQQQAHEIFSRCIEAVKTMPHYHYGDQRKWQKLARERLNARQTVAA
jgi:hypothetical protein